MLERRGVKVFSGKCRKVKVVGLLKRIYILEGAIGLLSSKQMKGKKVMNENEVGGQVGGKKEVYWKRFVQKLGNVRVMRMMETSVASDFDKNMMSAVVEAILEEDAARLQGFAVVLSEVEVIVEAATKLKVAYWYARWWYLDMAENDWMTSGGVQVNTRNWRKLMLAWWRNAYDETKEEIKGEYAIRLEVTQAILARET